MLHGFQTSIVYNILQEALCRLTVLAAWQRTCSSVCVWGWTQCKCQEGVVTGELSCVSVKSHNQKWPGTCLYYTFHKSRETCSDTFSTNKKCDIFVGTKNWLNPCDVNWHEKAIIIILEVHFQLPINGNSLKCRPIWQQKLKTVFLGGAGVGILRRDCSWNTANYANRQNHLETQPCSWFLARPR